MADQVVTELVIDADTSGADRYSQAMAGAEAITASTLQTVAGIGKEFSALSAVIGGGGMIAALAGLSEFIKSSNKDLADMAAVAHQVGLSLTDFQAIRFGGAIAGLSTDQINAGLEKSASLLNDASRNSNSLSKELDANGISIRNANGQLISENQLLGIAADLIKNAKNPGDQLAIAQMLGFTKEWIPLLQQGAGAMSGLAAEAKAAGAIIDDSTINKATDFDAQWRKSSVTFAANMKAALADILPGIDDLINRAGQFIAGLSAANGSVAGSGQTKFNEWADSLAISARIDDGTASVKDLERAIEILNNHHTAVPQDLLDQLAQLRIEAAAAAKEVDTVNRATQAANFPGGVPLPGSRPAGANAVGNGSSVVASKDVAGDAVDRAINQLQKHTEAQLADAKAVGLGDAALAGFRAEAAETAAVLANGGKETDKQVDAFSDLKDKAEAAAEALARAKVASQIDFAQKTAFLSPEDVAIANQLKGIYGNDIPAALASTEAAAIRVNDAIKQAKDDATQFTQTFVNGLLSGKSAMDSLVASAQQLSTKLADKAIQDLFSGNFVQAGVEGAIAIGTAIFAGDEKQKQALEQAKAQWAAMTSQVMAFNEAAKGVSLGPLTQELQSLSSTLLTLQTAALKANDLQGVAQLDQQFGNAVLRIVDEFKNGTAVLTPYQQAVKAINDEAAGLEDTLNSLHDYSLANQVAISAGAQIAALAQRFADSLTTTLQGRINTAQGHDDFNQASALLTQHQQDILQAQQLGISQSLVQQTFAAEAQKIVNDAGLVGDSFSAFIKQFPQFAGVVTESATALKAASDQFAAMTKAINDYLNNLALGANSTLSPQQQLALAQSNFQQQYRLAAGGDQTALGSITQSADTLLNQAKGFYASSSGYSDIYNAVTAALHSLVGNGTSVPAPPPFPTSPLSGTSAGAIVPAVSQILGGTAANDNGAYFQQQTTALSQVFTQVGQAQIVALQNGVTDLGKRLDRIATAVESNRARPERPLAKAAGAFG